MLKNGMFRYNQSLNGIFLPLLRVRFLASFCLEGVILGLEEGVLKVLSFNVLKLERTGVDDFSCDEETGVFLSVELPWNNF